MREIVKIIERPFRVYVGKEVFWDDTPLEGETNGDYWDRIRQQEAVKVEWSFEEAHWHESEANIRAEALSRTNQLVKIEKKENN